MLNTTPWGLLFVAASGLLLGCIDTAVRPAQPAAPPATKATPRSAAPPAPERVHIYVPTGTKGTDASCEVHAAGITGGVNCGLHRLSWTPATSDIQAGPTIATQATSPAVSPSGERLVYVHPQHRKDTIHIVDLADNRDVAVVTGLDQNKFADWLDDDTILFSTPNQEARCIGEDGRCTRMKRWNQLYRYDVRSQSARPFLRLATHSISDPSPHPLTPTLVAGHGGWLPDGADTSCSRNGRDNAAVSCNAAPDGMPLVWDTVSDRGWQYVLQTTRNGETVPLSSCAHVSWSPDGNTLLCTEQKTRALARSGVGNEVYAIPFDRSQPKGVQKVTVQPLFTHSRNPLDGGSCPKLIHKQVEYCHDNDHVVVTVGCTARGSEQAARYSRVYLIDISAPEAPQYTDLTAIIEDAQGTPRGTLRSYSATCAAP